MDTTPIRGLAQLLNARTILSQSIIIVYFEAKRRVQRQTAMHWPEVSAPLLRDNTNQILLYLIRFSEIEQIAVLSVLLLHYRITILEEPRYAHETIEERKRRILATNRHMLLVKPVRTPVVFMPGEGVNIFGLLIVMGGANNISWGYIRGIIDLVRY